MREKMWDRWCSPFSTGLADGCEKTRLTLLVSTVMGFHIYGGITKATAAWEDSPVVSTTAEGTTAEGCHESRLNSSCLSPSRPLELLLSPVEHQAWVLFLCTPTHSLGKLIQFCAYCHLPGNTESLPPS